MILDKVLSKLKVYGVTTSNADELNLLALIDDTKIDIITYCNLEKYPEDNLKLDNILVNLVVFKFLKSKNTTISSIENNQMNENVRSINVGDFSVSYGTNNSAITNEFIDNGLKDYYLMLNTFRRLVW